MPFPTGRVFLPTGMALNKYLDNGFILNATRNRLKAGLAFPITATQKAVRSVMFFF
jgi:hypothetical protein